MSSRVSIIMPAFNAESTITAAIDSVLSQVHENWELLIVDDGSSDGTCKLATSFADSRIQLIQQNHRGVSAARNKALKRMTGEFFCFLDADDAFTPRSLNSRLEVFSRSSQTRFVDGRVLVKDKDLATTVEEFHPCFVGEPLDRLLSLDSKCFFGPTWMFKRSGPCRSFKVGLTHGEDLLFFIHTAADGGILDHTDEIILHYRSGNKSAMSNLNGLECGYREIAEQLSELPGLSSNDIEDFRGHTKRIMVRSYLRNLKPLAALRLQLTG